MRLEPFDRPPGLLQRIAWWMSRRQLGGVMSPLKVIYARAPHLSLLSYRRGLIVELTEPGRQRLEEILPAHFATLEAHLWSVLTPRELEQLSDLMRKVRDANA